MLPEPARAAQTTWYLWLYRTGHMGPAIILYYYRKTRGGDHLRDFRPGFSGYLHVDGYPGHHKVAGVTLIGCCARRKFDEALKALPESKQAASKEGLDFCKQLFAIERDLQGVTPEKRYADRWERSRPVLDAFSAWFENYKSLGNNKPVLANTNAP